MMPMTGATSSPARVGEDLRRLADHHGQAARIFQSAVRCAPDPATRLLLADLAGERALFAEEIHRRLEDRADAPAAPAPGDDDDDGTEVPGADTCIEDAERRIHEALEIYEQTLPGAFGDPVHETLHRQYTLIQHGRDRLRHLQWRRGD